MTQTPQQQTVHSAPPNGNGPHIPRDLDAERAILGACLQGNPDTINDVTTQLVAADPFYAPRHTTIWNAIQALHAKSAPADPITVAAHIIVTGGRWREPDDRLYLHELYEQAPTNVSVGWHAAIVNGHAVRRSLIEDLTRALQRLDEGKDPDTVRVELAASQPVTDTRHNYIDGATFVLDLPVQHPSIWGDEQRILWAPGEALLIAGPSGVGKSTLAGQVVAARLGLIDTVLGLPIVVGQRRVLYLACDRPAQIARSLHRTLREEWRDILAARLTVWKGPPLNDFAKLPSLMRSMAEEAGADTIVIDSLKDVAIGLSDDEVGSAYNRARQLTLAAGIEVIELHHQVKRGVNGKEPTTLADVYGSIWLTAGAGSVILLWGDAGDPIVKLTHLKQPAEEVGPLNVSHDHVAGVSKIDREVNLVTLTAHASAGLTAAEAAAALFDVRKPDRNQIEKARRKLDKLVDTGRLITGRGRVTSGTGPSPITYHAAADDEEK